MKHFIAIVALGALAACVQSETASAPVPPVTEGKIETKAQFLSTIAGKTLRTANENGEATEGQWNLAPDGSWSGKAGDTNFTGTWTWEDGAWCRVIQNNTSRAPDEDCQLMEMVSPNFALITRDRGEGRSFYYLVSN